MDEEVQFVMSQIDISYEKDSGTKKRKTEVPTYDFQTPLNLSLQRIKFLFETSIHSSNNKKQSGLAGNLGIHTSGERRRSTRSTELSTPRSTRSSRRKKAKQSPEKSPIGEYDAWQYAYLKKKVGEKYGGPIQVSNLRSTRLEAGRLTSVNWLILDRDNYKRRWRMTHFTDISSTPEFKAYEGTQKHLEVLINSRIC
jgi:hypothetical protein